MKVIICGAGRVGSTIARYLAEDENDVVVIDTDAERLETLASSLDIQTVKGFASYPSVLERADAQNAEMLIAVTSSDEVNLVICQMANSLFKVPTKIARLRSAEYVNSKWKGLYSHDAFPVDVVISPEVEIARAIRTNISFPGAFDVLTLSSDKVYLLGIHCDQDCPLLNTSLRQLTALFPDIGATVAGIVRNGKMSVADSGSRFLPGDDIYLFVGADNVQRTLTLFGLDREHAKSALILGGNDIGLSLARYLERNARMQVSVIEDDPVRAKMLAETLTETTVINGDFLDTAVLEEAGIDIVETVIAVSGDDENNILASLMAKKYGAEQTVSVIEKTLYSQMVSNLGVDVVIDPKDIMVSSILQHIRRGRIYSAYSVRSGLCEVLEADVFDSFAFAGMPLRDVRLPAGSIIGAIVRDGETVRLRGDTVIEKGDRLVLFAVADAVKSIEKLFSADTEAA